MTVLTCDTHGYLFEHTTAPLGSLAHCLRCDKWFIYTELNVDQMGYPGFLYSWKRCRTARLRLWWRRERAWRTV